MKTGGVSFWWDEIGLPAARPGLTGNTAVDVCIIGAGYTGLWAAWYLAAADPTLRILIVEREFAGFGASGRNGGWLTGGFAWSHARYGAGAAALVAAMGGSVAEILRVVRAEGIDADIFETDELTVATNPAQWARLQADAKARSAKGEADRITLIENAALARRLHIPGALGAVVVSGVARVQPAKLVRGLAQAVERRGVRIAEGTAVTGFAPGQVITTQGRVTARIILRCTEGFTATLPGHRRDLLPLNSAQIVTAPLRPEVWDKIGWQGHEIVGDFAHSYFYAQRTAAGRIALGARGVPHRYASGIDHDGRPDPVTVAHLRHLLARHFPAAAGAEIAHAWCGVLGVPRDWCAGVGFDPATGIGHAGGYVGVGVSTANLAGRTLADLALGRDTPLARLPWVNRKVRHWEPEPLRWLGVRGMYAAYALADRFEARGGGPSRLAQAANWLAGR